MSFVIKPLATFSFAMASPSPTIMPAPIGGIPSRIELGPSVAFVLVYFALTAWFAVRQRKPSTRIYTAPFWTGLVLLNSMVSWAVRAHLARLGPGGVTRNGLLIYLQVSYALGFTLLLDHFSNTMDLRDENPNKRVPYLRIALSCRWFLPKFFFLASALAGGFGDGIRPEGQWYGIARFLR